MKKQNVAGVFSFKSPVAKIAYDRFSLRYPSFYSDRKLAGFLILLSQAVPRCRSLMDQANALLHSHSIR